MKFYATLTVLATVACVAAADEVLPTGVDPSKPDSVKSYASSVLAAASAIEPELLKNFPSDRVEIAKKFIESPFSTLSAALATETDPAKLSALATEVAQIDQVNKVAATNPAAIASGFNSKIDAYLNSSKGKGNGASGVSVSAAHLAAGTFAGVAAFAALF